MGGGMGGMGGGLGGGMGGMGGGLGGGMGGMGGGLGGGMGGQQDGNFPSQGQNQGQQGMVNVPGQGQQGMVSVPGQESTSSSSTSVPGQSSAAKQPSLADASGKKGRNRNKKTSYKKTVEDENYKEGNLFTTDPNPVDMGPDYGYSKIRLHKNEEVSVYAEQNDTRYSMDPRKRNCIIAAVVLVVLTIVVIILPDITFTSTRSNMYLAALFSVGDWNKLLAMWIEDLAFNVECLSDMFTLQAYDGKMTLKVCQYLIVILAGAGLAATGAMYQGALKNAMAAPSTLGVMSGAQLGTVIFVLLGGSTTIVSTGSMTLGQWSSQYDNLNLIQYIWAKDQESICALLGSALTVFLVVGISYLAGHGKVSKSALIISGTVFTTVITSVIQLVRYWVIMMGDEDAADSIENVSTGTLSQTFTPLDVALVGIPVIICIIILCTQAYKMNLLAFTDEEAQSMGLSPHKSRILVIAVCTIMTAVIVAFCGGISFVGFMVPHITRKIVGPDFKYLVPGSMLVGAIYCVITNAFTNMALSGMGMGSITGIIGSVAFIASVIYQRRNGNADWV